MSCSRCNGKGVVMAEHKTERTGPYAFKCEACTSYKHYYNDALPIWANDKMVHFVPEYDVGAMKALREQKDQSNIRSELFHLFKTNKPGDPIFKRAIKKYGRDKVVEIFKEYSK